LEGHAPSWPQTKRKKRIWHPKPQLLTLNAQLTTFVAGVQPPDLLGRIIAPTSPAQLISDVKFNWWKFDPAEYLRKQDTKVNRRGTIPVTDFSFTTDSDTLADHGQQIVNPNDISLLSEGQPPQILQAPVNVRMAKLKALTETFCSRMSLRRVTSCSRPPITRRAAHARPSSPTCSTTPTTSQSKSSRR